MRRMVGNNGIIGKQDMATQKLSPGIHPMQIFGYEFDDSSYCWMMDDGELWLSMIIVKEEHRGNGVLHRLLEDAKDMSEVVVIPEPRLLVAWTALKHGYLPLQRGTDGFGEIDVMVWRRTINED